LDTIRVIDLTHNVLGPLATQVLGDAGADVIKIEGPAGDPVRKIGPSRTADMGAYFYQLNRNKRSVVLDLKQPAERAALHRLIAGADVFVHNIRTGAAERLGLSYKDLAAQNSRLIYASATGFRQDSELRDQPAFDDTMQGACGLASLNRDAGGAPRYVPTVLADKVCGQVLASAIGMALFHRERTGQGQEIHVPMMDTMLAFLLVEHLWGASICEPERGLGYPRMLTPHRRPYATKDGHICVIAVTDDQWSRLFAVIGHADLMLDPRFATPRARANHIDTLYAVLTEAMRSRSTADWLAGLNQADLPCGPVNSLEDLMHNDYLAQTGFFQPVEHPTEGCTTLLRNPVSFSATPNSVHRLPPKLGADTAAVLKELEQSRST
jgi:crotonobetainyl-CoA:carnitine CoA-transferase CaiB-like acyl-CoA transferase